MRVSNPVEWQKIQLLIFGWNSKGAQNKRSTMIVQDFLSVFGVYVGLPNELTIANSFIKQSMSCYLNNNYKIYCWGPCHIRLDLSKLSAYGWHCCSNLPNPTYFSNFHLPIESHVHMPIPVPTCYLHDCLFVHIFISCVLWTFCSTDIKWSAICPIKLPKRAPFSQIEAIHFLVALTWHIRYTCIYMDMSLWYT